MTGHSRMSIPTGWRSAHGLAIVPDMPTAEQRDNGEVALAQPLYDALRYPRP